MVWNNNMWESWPIVATQHMFVFFPPRSIMTRWLQGREAGEGIGTLAGAGKCSVVTEHSSSALCFRWTNSFNSHGDPLRLGAERWSNSLTVSVQLSFPLPHLTLPPDSQGHGEEALGKHLPISIVYFKYKDTDKLDMLKGKGIRKLVWVISKLDFKDYQKGLQERKKFYNNKRLNSLEHNSLEHNNSK